MIGRLNHRLILGLGLLAAACVGMTVEAVEVPHGGADGTDWPQWRGPTRDSQLATAAAWPRDLRSLKLIWRRPLGPSYSGPIVAAGLVFSTETQNQKREVVRALDRATGQQVWEQSWDGALSVPFFAKSNGDWIRSTPACAGDSLYVGGMRDVLVCLDARSGEPRWRKDFVQELGSPLPTFGCVCSPLADGSAVYIQAGAGLCKLSSSAFHSWFVGFASALSGWHLCHIVRAVV